MKRMTALILCLILCISLMGCGNPWLYRVDLKHAEEITLRCWDGIDGRMSNNTSVEVTDTVRTELEQIFHGMLLRTTEDMLAGATVAFLRTEDFAIGVFQDGRAQLQAGNITCNLWMSDRKFEQFMELISPYIEHLPDVYTGQHPEPEKDWGITLDVQNVTSTGLELLCTYMGGDGEDRPFTGSEFWIDVWDGTEWQEVEWVFDGELAWTLEAIYPAALGTISWPHNWELLYGELPEGIYRLGKHFSKPGSTDGTYEKQTYYVRFLVEADQEEDTRLVLHRETLQQPDLTITLHGDLLQRMEEPNERTADGSQLPLDPYHWVNMIIPFDYRVADPVNAAPEIEPCLDMRCEAYHLTVGEDGTAIYTEGDKTHVLTLEASDMEGLYEAARDLWTLSWRQGNEPSIYPYNTHMTYLPLDDAIWLWLLDHQMTAVESPFPVLCLDSADALTELKTVMEEYDGYGIGYGTSKSLRETLELYQSIDGWFDVYNTYLVFMRDDMAMQHMVSMEQEGDTLWFRIHPSEPEQTSDQNGIWMYAYSAMKEEVAKTAVVRSELGKPLAERVLFMTREEGCVLSIDDGNEKTDYRIFALDASDVRVNIDGTVYNLEQALQDGQVTMEELLRRAQLDALNGKCIRSDFNDGGTVTYAYERYSLVRKHTPLAMSGNMVTVWDEDIWITWPGAEIPLTEELPGEIVG